MAHDTLELKRGASFNELPPYGHSVPTESDHRWKETDSYKLGRNFGREESKRLVKVLKSWSQKPKKRSKAGAQ